MVDTWRILVAAWSKDSCLHKSDSLPVLQRWPEEMQSGKNVLWYQLWDRKTFWLNACLHQGKTFSQNIDKEGTLFSIYAGSSWEVTTSESNLLLLWLSGCLLSPGLHHQSSLLLGSRFWRWQQHLAVSALLKMHCRVKVTMTVRKSATAAPHDRWIVSELFPLRLITRFEFVASYIIFG